jgi:hypothetical protein
MAGCHRRDYRLRAQATGITWSAVPCEANIFSFDSHFSAVFSKRRRVTAWGNYFQFFGMGKYGAQYCAWLKPSKADFIGVNWIMIVNSMNPAIKSLDDLPVHCKFIFIGVKEWRTTYACHMQVIWSLALRL